MSYNPSSTSAKSQLSGATSGSITQFASAVTTSYSVTWPSAQAASSGYVLTNDGAGNLSWSPGSGSGTVTSVALTVPSFLSVSGSPITSTGTLAVTLSGSALPVANGGTGQTSTSSSFNALSPLTTAGDILFENATPANARLPIGSTGQVLTVVGGLPAWMTPGAGSGTVSSVSVVSANGFAGTVATATTTPAITLSTTVSGIILGNGTSISSATPGTDYVIPSGSITGNAATVTTNANLTGVVTSIGNATSIANGAITNAMLATSYNVNEFTLSGTDITNQFVTLSSAPDVVTSTVLTVVGGPMQSYGSDFTVSGSQLNFAGDIATGGNAALVSGDKLVVQYN